MAEEISDGSLQWSARIDTSELQNDIKSIADLFNKVGNFNFDTAAMDTVLKEQAAKEVEIRKDVSDQVKQINADLVTDTKNKAEEVQKFTETVATQIPKQPAQVEVNTEVIDKAREAYANASPEQKKFIDDLIEMQQQLAGLNKEQNDLRQAVTDGTISWQEYFAAFNKNVAEITEAQSKFKNLTVPVPGNLPDNYSEVLNQAKQIYEQSDAVTKKYYDDLTKLELRLSSLKGEQSNLNAAFKDGSISQDQYVSQTTELKAAVDNVGASIDTVKEAQAAYVQSLSSEGEATEKSITLLTEYRKLKNQIAADALNGVVNPEDINRAAELEETLKGVNTQIKLESSNAAFLSAAGEGVRGLVGAFSALSGVMSLVADNDEEANKIMQRTVGFLGVIQGLEQALQILESDGKLNTYIKGLLAKNTAIKAGTTVQAENNAATSAGTVAQEVNAAAAIADAGAKAAEATATEGATVAQWSLNAAMEANPVGIVLVALTALVAAYEYFASATDRQIEKQTELNKHLADTKKLMDDLADISAEPYKQRVIDVQQQIALAQAAGKSTSEISKLQQKLIDAKQDLNGYEAGAKGLTGTLEEQQQKVKALAEKYTDLKIRVNNSFDEKQKENLQGQLDEAEREYNVAKGIVDDRISLENEEQVTRVANQKKANELALANDAGYWNKKIALAQKGSKEWLDAQLNLNRIEYNKAIRQPDADINTAQANKILADRQASATAKQQAISDKEDEIKTQLAAVVAGSQKELNLKLDLLEQERNAAVISAENNAKEIERINAESEKKKNDIKLQYASEQAEKLLQLQEDNLKIMLADAVQGSEDYLNYSIGLNNTAANKNIKALVESAAKNNPAITANDVTLSGTFDESQALEFASKIEDIDANLAQRIRAIWAETNSKNQQDTNNFIQDQIDSANKLFSVQAELAKEQNNNIINDQSASDLAKINAQIRNNRIDLNEAKNQLTDFTNTIDKNYASQSNTIKTYINSVSLDYSRIQDLSNKDSDIFKAFDNIKDPQLKAALEEILKKIHSINIESSDLNKNKFEAYTDNITKIADSITSLGDSLSQYNSRLGQTISGLGSFVTGMVGVVKSIKTMSTETGKGQSSFEAYSSAITTAIQLIGMLVNAAAQRRQKEREYMASSIQQQKDYNLALNDSIRLHTQLKDNVFVTDYSGQIVDAWESISDATDKYNDALKNVEDLQVKIGTKKKVDGNAVLKGVGAGATAGASIGAVAGVGVLSVPAAAVGAIVGGLIGGIAGLFSKKRVDVYGNLFDKYPELFDKTKKGVDAFNDALAQSLIDSNKVKDSSKEVLQSLIDWKKQVEAAKEQMAQVVQTLAGNLGDTIANSLTDAFEQGTDAGEAFANSVKQTLENVIKQQLLNQVFGKAFDELQKRMESSFDPTGGGDMNWTDDLTAFFNQYGTLADQFEQGLQDAKDAAATAGLDIFDSTNSVKNTLAGAIQASITEDQASELTGLWRGQYDITKQTLQVATDALRMHQMIEANTAQALVLFSQYLPYLPNLNYLKTINDNTVPVQTRDTGRDGN